MSDERQRLRPRLFAAISADAAAFSSYRSERHRFGGQLERIANVLRLIWQADAFLAMLLCRLRMSLVAHHVPILPTLLHRMCMMLSQVSIGDSVFIDAGVYLLHGQISIDGDVWIGQGVTISPWVTIGSIEGNMQGPTLGDRVFVGTGAQILGPVSVGANAKIAANAVVLGDVPAGATVAGAPARVVRGGADDGRSEVGGGT